MVLAYLLTPWCRVLLEKLTGLQLVKKFPAFHETRMFITALTSVRHLSLSWASPIQSIYPHPTSRRFILILSTHLRLVLHTSLFPSGFPTKTLYTPLSSPIANRLLAFSCLSLRSSVLVYRLGCHWMNFHEICYWRFSFQWIEKIQILLESDISLGHFSRRTVYCPPLPPPFATWCHYNNAVFERRTMSDINWMGTRHNVMLRCVKVCLATSLVARIK